MRFIKIIACLHLGVMVPLLASPEPNENTTGPVEVAFYAYKTAILNDHGKEAAQLLSGSTIKYYEQMRDLALYATQEELTEQSTINLMQALAMRHRVPAGELKTLAGTELLAYAINHGWIGKSSVAPFRVKAIHIVGQTAIADIISDRDAGIAQFRFQNENGQWKLDLIPVMQATSVQLDMLIKKQGVTRDEFLFTVLSAASGRQVNESVWAPPLKQLR